MEASRLTTTKEVTAHKISYSSKIMVTVLWDAYGILLVHFFVRGVDPVVGGYGAVAPMKILGWQTYSFAPPPPIISTTLKILIICNARKHCRVLQNH